MNYLELIRDFKELNVTIVTEDDYGEVMSFPLWDILTDYKVRLMCKLGIGGKLNLELSWYIKESMYVLNSDLEYEVPISSLERLLIAESILEEL